MKKTTLKNTSRKPYIYKVTNFVTGQYYIGSQCIGMAVGVNYFTSSTNKEFGEDFKAHRDEKYKIDIIREFEDPDECVRVENYMIRDHMLLKDGLCLNRACCCSGEKVFSRVGTHHSEETKQKIGKAHKGIPRSEKTKQKMSKALKGTHHSEGAPRSEETKQKMSEAHKGIPLSEKTKQKISIALQGHPATNQIKISIEGMIFNSLTEAAKYYNVAPPSISYWLKTKKHNAVYIK